MEFQSCIGERCQSVHDVNRSMSNTIPRRFQRCIPASLKSLEVLPSLGGLHPKSLPMNLYITEEFLLEDEHIQLEPNAMFPQAASILLFNHYKWINQLLKVQPANCLLFAHLLLLMTECNKPNCLKIG